MCIACVLAPHGGATDRIQVFEDCALTLVRAIHPHRTVALAAGALLFPVLKQLWLEDVNFSTIVENQSFRRAECLNTPPRAGGLERLVLCGCGGPPGDLTELHEMVGEVDVRGGDMCLTKKHPAFAMITE